MPRLPSFLPCPPVGSRRAAVFPPSPPSPPSHAYARHARVAGGTSRPRGVRARSLQTHVDGAAAGGRVVWGSRGDEGACCRAAPPAACQARAGARHPLAHWSSGLEAWAASGSSGRIRPRARWRVGGAILAPLPPPVRRVGEGGGGGGGGGRAHTLHAAFPVTTTAGGGRPATRRVCRGRAPHQWEVGGSHGGSADEVVGGGAAAHSGVARAPLR